MRAGARRLLRHRRVDGDEPPSLLEPDDLEAAAHASHGAAHSPCRARPRGSSVGDGCGHRADDEEHDEFPPELVDDEEKGAGPPCGHNSWDNVRIKRHWAILRCRTCEAQWRRRPAEIKRCPEFGRELGSSCPRGSACPWVHVHYARARREKVLQQRRHPKASSSRP
ncbi:hypothetical protein DIPPA_12524 [Diplonema papillatum]|nr:hypothetical protein DIPPA_12524 [Diplonema papillatum]